MTGMRLQTRISDLNAILLKTLCEVHCVMCMLFHTNMQCAQVLKNAGTTQTIHSGTQQHSCTIINITQSIDKLLSTANNTTHCITTTVNKFGKTVNHHICAQCCRCDSHWGECIVYY